MLFRFVRAFVDFVLGLITCREYVGLENIPSEPPYILATNHLSGFDSPLLLVICPHAIRAFAAAKHRRNPLYASILGMMGSIWVKRGEVDRRALKEALAVLERGEALGVAPEGTRARGPYALQEGKVGAAYLATRADVPIVPVGIVGSERIMRNLARLRRTDVQIIVGEPFRLPESGRVRSKKLRQYTDLIMHRIADLLPVAYRGVYSEDSQSVKRNG
ncbi:MAG TPA: 1-acyl-sn-glycerol-3-phosphate acyltransferase [Chloroflexi bacterium]|nr:1-acyl-sn-glycerol-3-phosphate acyltransferase [Chloroflexota bacterium]